MSKKRPRDPLLPVVVIDRAGRDGDHLFVAEHQGRQALGAVGADWQRNPQRRARAGLVEEWEQDDAAMGGPGPRLRAVVEVPRQLVELEGVEFFDVMGRPMFVLPAEVRFGLGDGHGDDALVERARAWYQAAWTVVAMTQFIEEVADLRAAMLKTGHEKTRDFQEIELELSQARMAITKARSVLVSARKQGVTPVTGSGSSGS